MSSPPSPVAAPFAPLPGVMIAELLLSETIEPAHLTEEERRLFDALPTGPRRAEWWAGRICARSVLEASGAARLSVLTDARGAPRLDGPGAAELHLAITHGRRRAAAVASRLDGPWPRVGIDLVDPEDLPRLERIAARVFTTNERALAGSDRTRLLLAWAAREAIAKASATGMFAFGLHGISVCGFEGARIETTWPETEVCFEPRDGGFLVVAAMTARAFAQVPRRDRAAPG